MCDAVLEALNKTEEYGTTIFSVRFWDYTVEELDALADLCVAMASYKVWDIEMKVVDDVYRKSLFPKKR